MFKKANEIKALQRLSGADRKKLRRAALSRFRQATEADIDAILPPKLDVSVSKLVNRVLVYAVDGAPPVLFEVDGEIFPTVYTLWKLPNLLPAFVLKGAEVSRYVVGGADLMFPGIDTSHDYPAFEEGEPWAVKVPGNDFAIAVGSTGMSSAAAQKAGFRGRAVRIMHYYPDTLWSSAEGKYVPNAGFTEQMVYEDPSNKPAEATKEEIDDPSQEGEQPSEAQAVEPVKNADDPGVDVGALKLEEAEDTEAGTSAPMSVEEIDSLLDKCLLQALHTTVKDKDLPIPGSTLWSAHILPCRPPGYVLDIKKSSHKKLSKWLQSKSATNLIAAKEDKHRKEIMLCSVNRGHPLYQEFKVEKKAPEPAPVKPVKENESTFEAIEVWKCTSHVAPIFRAVGADERWHYTAPEASEVVFSYVEKENLVKPDDKAVVVLDAILCDALFKGAVKKGSSYPSQIHKKDLGAAFLGRMQANHKVTRGSESVVKKGALRNVQIVTERRQGNKKVTRVSGVECFLINAEAVAAELQKKLACSTSTAEVPGKKGEYEVIVQGGVLEDVGRYLVQQYGIPKRFIETLDKTRK